MGVPEKLNREFLNMKNVLLIGVALLFACIAKGGERMSIDLSGKWGIRLDPDSIGVEQAWMNQGFEDELTLPGCLQEQGYGERPGPDTEWWSPLDLSQRHPSLETYGQADENFKLVQYLMPRHHYIGKAWYSKEIQIPDTFEGKRVVLSLERCHWGSTVWVDGVKLGSNDSLAAPHEYDLSNFGPGTHRLSIRIDNGQIQNLGKMAHSVSDQTAGTWNGIVGEISLSASDRVYLESIDAYPDIETKSVKVVATLGNVSKRKGKFEIVADAKAYNSGDPHDPEHVRLHGKLDGSESQIVEFNYPLGDGMQLWDEFDPRLYKLDLSLSAGDDKDDMEVSFGVREISHDGTHFFVNGVKTFLRGSVDCAVNPETGYAPMSVDRWKEIFRTYKAFGLNHVRFHSWCPPKQALIAADEVGMYMAPEVHEWTSIKPGPQHDYLKTESARILDYLGNHASFVLMGLGNESGIDAGVAKDLVSGWKEKDSRRLYTCKASVAWDSGKPDEIDFEVLGHVKTEAEEAGKDRQIKGGRIGTRYQAFWPPIPEGSQFVAKAPQTVIDWSEGVDFYHSRFSRPLVAHETAQICAYPDVFNEMSRYTGYLRPTYLEIAVDQLEERGMTDQVADFVRDSGAWQVELTREETEAFLRTPGYAGYQWLALNDFTGQNTAPVGFTDAFYNVKPYVNPNDAKRFFGETVLLARLPQRVYTSGEQFRATFELSHFGKERIDLDDFEAIVRDEAGKEIASKSIKAGLFDQGNAQGIGEMSVSLSGLPAPAQYNLELRSRSNGVSNNWGFWVYPEEDSAEFPSGVSVVREWNDNALQLVEQGGKVLLLPTIGDLKGNLPGCFTTYYWTSFGEEGGQSSACGITLDPSHPLFKEFVTDSHASWQWWDILTQCQPMILDQFEESSPWAKDYRPLIQPIDTWKLNRKLGLVVEAKVGKGSLLICSIDIESDLTNRPVARQFRKSLLAYVASEEFAPANVQSVESIAALFDQSKRSLKESLQGLPTDTQQ